MNSGPVQVFAASIRRDWQVARTYRFVLVFELISTIIALSLFFFVGKSFSSTAGFGSERFPHGYFAFAAVGTAMFIIVSNTISSPVARLRDGQATGSLEALLATPVAGPLLILAAAAYDVLRAHLSALVSIAAAVVVFSLSLNVSGAAAASVVVGVFGAVTAGAAFGLLVASAGLVVRRGDTLTGFVTTGAALVSGVYYPTEVLPHGLREFAGALPTTWSIDLVRAGLLNGTFREWDAVGVVLVGPLALVFAAYVLELALRDARRRGTLSRV